MVVLVLSLAAAGVLGALLLGTVFNSSGSSQASVSNAPGVAEASGIQAQQTLSAALNAIDNAASASGYASLSAATLSESDPSIAFVEGPSSNSSTVSLSVVSGTGAGSVGGTGDTVSPSAVTGVQGVDGIGGAGEDDGAGGTGGTESAGSGSVTMADRSTVGTCWLVWKSSGSPTWYGAQTDQPSCTAPALASPPSSGPVSSTSIGWQENSFPGV